MEIISMKNCSFEDALTSWNEGFQDYSVQIQMELDGFLKMMSSKRLSPAYSFIVYDREKPVGIVLNGIQEIDGIKTAYNGGTAVHPSYRKRGVGRLLVHSSLSMYEKENASVATLEALSENQSAIALYEAYGYQIVDHLHIMRSTPGGNRGERLNRLESMDEREWKEQMSKGGYPWQNQPFSIEKGEFFKVTDGEATFGGLVFTRNDKGRITLFQLQSEKKGRECLKTLRSSCPNAIITAFNIPEISPAYEALKQEGFETQLQQVWMKKVLGLK
ncbi:GNAT family N-acetyltransferase [Halobacillus trueperi]|uniref:GNAT family N-acetyltransferase n=1 Tax=Halobacillus trueperi TaxID=156205 RepID=A0A3D8VTC0_9BACI|nr:GNAT family N-acetyltransferase [Halobacillus trueperi]RDY72616.1 GNAT family N-acetyltransferase [Halobacillus trueperi]